MKALALVALALESLALTTSHAKVVVQDSFSDGQIAPIGWKVLGTGASINMSSNRYAIRVAGGSCGTCGQGDAVIGTHAVKPITGDFEAELEFSQDERTAADGSLVRSGIYLEMLTPDSQAGSISVALVGDHRTNGEPFHGVYAQIHIGGALVAEKEMPISKSDIRKGVWRFHLARAGGTCTLKFFNPSATEVLEMEPAPCATDPSVPQIVAFSGSGGATTINGTYGATLKRVKISTP
jgi:hypothetical protein